MGIFQLHEIFKRRCCLKHLQTFLALSPIALWQPMEIRNPRETRMRGFGESFHEGYLLVQQHLGGFNHLYGRMDKISQTFQIFAKLSLMFWKGFDGDNDSFWIRWWDTIFQFENRCGQIVISVS